MLLALVVSFGAGVVSFLAPCTMPLLPAYVGVLSGAAAGVDPSDRPRRLVVGSLLYVAGFTAVFVTLGLVAGSVGAAVRRAGGPVQRAGGAVVLVLAVLLLLDSRWHLLSRWASGGAARHRVAASRSPAMPAVLGVVTGTAFTPCVGPFLGGVLALAAGDAGAARGGVLLAAYSLGLGVPFVLAALVTSSSPRAVRAMSRVSAPVSVVGAVLLAALGVVMVTGRYGAVASWFLDVLPLPAV